MTEKPEYDNDEISLLDIYALVSQRSEQILLNRIIR